MGRKLVGAFFLFFVMSLGWGSSGWAQIVPSETESLIVISAAAPKVPGTTVSVVISLANERYISGISGRLVYDTNLIAPIITESTLVGGSYQYKFSIDKLDRGTSLTGVGAGPAGHNAIGFVLFSLVPTERIIPGSGPVCRLNFRVNAALDTTFCMRLEDDTGDGLKNGLSDTNFVTILPSLAPASLQLGAGSATGGCGPIVGPGNKSPVITPVASQTVQQGSILSFSVTASDPDGNNVTLSATSLPPNAIFNTVTGDSVVFGTFSFSPSLSQVGNFTVIFRAVDDSGAAITHAVNITVTEVLQDVLFSSSVTGQAPTGAIPGKTFALFPVDFTTRGNVYGINFDLQYDGSVLQLDSIIPTARLENLTVDFRPLPGQPNRLRFLIFSLQGDSIRTSATPTILHLAFGVSSLATPGKSTVVIDSGWEVTRVGAPSQPLLTQNGEFFIDQFGDATGDAHIDVADVVALVGYILGDISFTVRQFDAANTNQDSEANIIDLVNVINLIFGVPLPPPAQPYIGPPATLALNAESFVHNPGEPIKLEADLPTEIAGVQVHITYDPNEVRLAKPEKTFLSDSLVLQSNEDEDVPGRMSFVLYNMRGPQAELPAGKGTIVEIPATRLNGVGNTVPPKLAITRAFLSTGNGGNVPVAGIGASVPRKFELFQNYPNPFNPKTTIRFNVSAADGGQTPAPVKLQVFNILGQSVKTLLNDRRAPGTYSLEWDGTDAGGNKVSSGIYFYRLTSEKFSVTKKMLFLK